MKTLYESICESLCEDFFDNVGSTFELIDRWCKDNINGECVIDRKTLTINSPSDIKIIGRSLTEFPSYIHFGIVRGDFYCNDCSSLRSLEGAPAKVGGDFCCNYCNSLTSLEGAPKKVDGCFYCNSCNSLKSLKGAPKEVGRSFYCDNCTSLVSLEGAPKKVGWNFSCNGCTSLKSLKGISPIIKGKIYSDTR